MMTVQTITTQSHWPMQSFSGFAIRYPGTYMPWSNTKILGRAMQKPFVISSSEMYIVTVPNLKYYYILKLILTGNINYRIEFNILQILAFTELHTALQRFLQLYLLIRTIACLLQTLVYFKTQSKRRTTSALQALLLELSR